jgi:hypothetical protein
VKVNESLVNLLALTWFSTDNEAAAHNFASRFIARFKQAAEDLEVFHPFTYINYANKGQDVFSGYGQKNKERLMAVQTEIDPLRIFTSGGLWPGFFKVQ